MFFFIDKYLILIHHNNYWLDHCRVYGSFTLEAILATAFGRQVNIQKGESDEFSEAVDTILNAFIDGQSEQFILLNSEIVL